jgi:hypothetical protein
MRPAARRSAIGTFSVVARPSLPAVSHSSPLRPSVLAAALVLVAASTACSSSEGLRSVQQQQDSRVPQGRPNAEQRTVRTAPERHTTPVHVDRMPTRRVEVRPEPEIHVPEIRVPELDCSVRPAVGYRRGKPFAIDVVTIDGAPIERATANAYWEMRAAAAKDGVELTIYSAFRRPEEQQYFYQCYKTCSCNGCSQAAKPGFSNHQSGHALDIAVWSPDVHPWLVANAPKFGFASTVPKEPWHWEFRGKPRKAGVCG